MFELSRLSHSVQITHQNSLHPQLIYTLLWSTALPNPMERVYRIIDDEVHIGDYNQPVVLIQNRTMIAISRTMYLSRVIPETGFGFVDLMTLAMRLNVRSPWLAAQLSRPEYEGIAGGIAASLGLLNRMDLDGESQQAIVAGIVNRMVQHATPVVTPARQITTVVEPLIEENETCVVCLDTKAEEPSLPWATAAGCERHRFHLKCLQKWQGNTCMTCRAPLN